MTDFIPNDNLTELERRLEQLSLSVYSKFMLRAEVSVLDGHGIPFTWKDLFERYGLGKEYEKIKDMDDSPSTPVEQGSDLEKVLKTSDLSLSMQTVIRLELIILNSRGYKVNVEDFVKQHSDLASLNLLK